LRKGGQSKDFIYSFQELVCNILAELCNVIKYITDESERRNKRERLRKTYENLDNKLGQIVNKPIINRSSPDNYDLYLDRNLSICVVVP
jgi:hypothetical protein